jgi:protein phosphatase
VREANRAVLAEASARGSNMGTTLGVAVLKDGKAYIANVGDSRAYWIENGTIRQITEDHSLVAKLVSAGKLTKEEARTHPKSNLLYRTIGSESDVKVDTFEADLVPGGSLLLCSDGLWGEVPDEEIHHICKTSQSPVLAVLALIDAANRNGGKDNITAVVVNVKS